MMDENNASESFLSFQYGFHKLPVAWYKCYMTVYDYSVLTTLTSELAEGLGSYGDIVTTFFWNIFYNWVDIMYEFLALRKAFDDRNWTDIGTFAAKMASDILFKNPEDKSWNYKNSDVITHEWGTAPSFY